MIRIFNKDTTDFTPLGKVLKPQSASITEELNGEYALKILITEDAEIHEEDIITAPAADKTQQAFRVYKIERDEIEAIQTVYCRHIFYDNLDNYIDTVDNLPMLANGQEGLDKLFGNTVFAHNFKMYSDITKHLIFNFQDINPVEALLGSDKFSFINQIGGELKRDNWNISMLKKYASKKPVSIIYGKNLLQCGLTSSIENTVTRIIPSASKEDGSKLFLPERYIDSPLINYYAHPKVKHIHYSDIKVGEANCPDEATALNKLREAVQAEFDNGLDKLEVGGTVNMVELCKTEEYKTVPAFNSLLPFDDIKIILKSGKTATSRMKRYEYNSLTQKYERIEFGAVNHYLGYHFELNAQPNYKY